MQRNTSNRAATASASLSPEAIRAAFQSRRRRFLALSLTPSVLALPLVFFGAELARALGVPPALLVGAGLGLLAAGAAYGFAVYRCPACGAHPTGSASAGRAPGVRLAPTACPDCGVRLR